MIAVSGTGPIGPDGSSVCPGDAYGQAKRCLEIIRKAIEDAGGDVIAAASIIDRSAGAVDLGVPFFPLIELNFPTYAPDELPPELAATEAVKPGSRKA